MPLLGLLKIISDNSKFTPQVFPNVVWQIQNLRIPNAPVPLYDHQDTKIPFLGPHNWRLCRTHWHFQAFLVWLVWLILCNTEYPTIPQLVKILYGIYCISGCEQPTRLGVSGPSCLCTIRNNLSKSKPKIKTKKPFTGYSENLVMLNFFFFFWSVSIWLLTLLLFERRDRMKGHGLSCCEKTGGLWSSDSLLFPYCHIVQLICTSPHYTLQEFLVLISLTFSCLKSWSPTPAYIGHILETPNFKASSSVNNKQINMSFPDLFVASHYPLVPICRHIYILFPNTYLKTFKTWIH